MPSENRPQQFGTQLHPWWRAWETFAPRCLMVAVGRLPIDPHVFDTLEQMGFDTKRLRAWQPNHNDGVRVQNAIHIVNRALREHPPRLEERKIHLGQQLAGTGHWEDVRRLAGVYLDGWIGRTEATAMSVTPGPLDILPKNFNKKRLFSNQIRRQQNHKLLADLSLRTALETTSNALENFLDGISELTLYIDEAWPVERGSIDRNEGVIGGLLCQGPPEYLFKTLPAIATHVYQRPLQARQALEHLWSCSQCLPLIFPLRLPREDEHAGIHYDLLLQQALRLLCGWLLPRMPQTIRLHVCAEAIAPAHPEGDEATEFHRGLLAGDSGERFAHWDLATFAWRDKNFGYIPYADLLAHLTLEHTEVNRALGNWSNFKKLPGYVPLSLELVPRLERLEHLEHSANLADVIEFALETGDSRFGRLVMTDIARRLAVRPELQTALLEQLEEDYRDKVRDLCRLRRAFGAVRGLLPTLPENAGPRMRLLWYLLALQDANHDGDPTRSHAVACEYRRERDRLRENARELCADADLNLAVHDADRFAFGHAELTVLEWVEDPLFHALSLRQQARLQSALGQYRAMRGAANEAEACFVRALKLFERADLSDRERAGEGEQTRIYRAINALDAGWPETPRALAEVFGRLDAATAVALAHDGSPASQYRHHLFVRALVLRPELTEARDAYLAARAEWSDGSPQHPWPGIQGHRGFLLWNREQLDADMSAAAQTYFTHAIEVSALECHGPTMRLIGAFWATVAACCFENCGYEDQGRALLDQARVLPDAAPIIEMLDAALRAPDTDRLGEVFSTLPFNYR
ncbi:hypothetical protein CKO25_12635 [Thiocapsa imhoffii]|uniref:Uncharacterized protein n=1 Tax=Thiocapsa imhoffii TaxID=382777 RepID=A0A9X0WJI4_9GAMM|nr:hypothetical protein [Thiocapsa imhoffii]MBK1645474.1 hypothetical protein [Thiocapsa imhoffii]